MTAPTEVFIATKGDYSDYHIKGVFSSEEEAERFVSQFGGTAEKWILDELKDAQNSTIYRCDIRIDDGSLGKEWNYKQMVLPGYRGEHVWMCQNIIHGISAQSPEHARKLAVEGRQAELRKQGVVE